MGDASWVARGGDFTDNTREINRDDLPNRYWRGYNDAFYEGVRSGREQFEEGD